MSLNLNLKDFLKFVKRYKWWVIIIPIICLVITYFLLDKLPKKYTSESLIATGITSQVQQSQLVENRSDWQESDQKFNNLIQMMQSRRVISNLSYKLILHDLKDSIQSFKEYSEIITQLSTAQKQEAIKILEERYLNNVITSPEEKNVKLPLFGIISSMGYDEGSLLQGLSINRNGGSDFIKVSYTGTSPNLTAFVVNSLSNDFVFYYTDLTVRGQKQALAVLDTLLRQRQDDITRKTSQLTSSAASASASAASALNAQRQADIVNSQLAEAQGQKSQIVRTISSLQASIAEIESKLRGGGGYISNNSVKENAEITNIDNQLAIANRRYVNNNFNARDKATIDSLNNIKIRLIAQSSGSSSANQAAIKQDLITQKMRLENDLASAKSALTTVEGQIKSIGGAGSVSVSPVGTGVDAAQQILMQDAQTSAQQYAQTQAQYDQIMLSAKTGSKLSVAESALPGTPEKSKDILFLGFSYISSFLICLLTLFAIFATNTTISTPEQLKLATKQKILGSLNNITEEDKDLRKIWNDNENIVDYGIYKDLLRSLRFELDRALTGNDKILGITSLYENDGKSFLSGSLAYAFAMMGKNVLLISDKDSSLSELVTNKKNKKESPQGFESFIIKKEIQIEDRITILNRNQNNKSLLELRDNTSLHSGFQILKETFDTIIIDLDSSEKIHYAKEWLSFCDKTISVFKSGNKIKEQNKDFLQFLSKQKGFLGWVLNKVPVSNA